MRKTKLLSILVAGALAVVAVIGVAAYRTVEAAAPAQTSSAHLGFGRGGEGAYTSEDLAAALGITVDELSSAYQTATNAALDQAVQAGLITQAQADQIRERGSTFPLGNRWGSWLSQNGIDYDALLADALGISVEDLRAAYVEAYNTRVDQAVADGRLTQEQGDLMKGQNALYSNEAFRSSMQSAFEAVVQQAVADGVITQTQADQILSNSSGMNFFGPKGFDGPGGFGRHGRPGGDLPGSPSAPTAPSTTPSTGL
jgi:hypothetical protein